MKAKMSDRERRADVDVFDSLPRPFGESYQANDIWALAAQTEALAILAETEPERCGRYQRLTWFGDWSPEVAELITAFVES